MRDLLRMRLATRPSRGWRPDRSGRRRFLAHRCRIKPGTHFLYNTPATYMLSAIVQKATGETVIDYLQPRLFEPLGIEHPTWETSPQGINAGGYGLSIRTEDIAKFGQLYLQKGKWQGKQLVPAAWVDGGDGAADLQRQQSQERLGSGLWLSVLALPSWGYRGDGAFGQFCIVLPEQDAVVAITSGVAGHAGGDEPGLGQAAPRPGAGTLAAE